jgi:hypothetical protein
MVGRKIERSSRELARGLFTTNLWLAVLGGLLLITISYYVFPVSDGVNEYPPVPTWTRILHSGTHEIGFALIVAAVIWRMFEFFAQKESKDQWDGVVEQISQNVFAAMLKRELPEKLITQAFDLILNQQFIRTDVVFTFMISAATYTVENHAPKPFVRLNVVAKSKIKNVSNATARIPLGMSLPNPMIDELKPFCIVKKIAVKTGGVWTDFDLTNAERSFRAAMIDDARKEVPFLLDEMVFAPKEEKEVIIDYVLAKEEEDNEVVQMRFPAESLLITVVDDAPGTRVIRAKAIHPADLENLSISDDIGPYTYKLDQFLLPHQGFVIWWKTRPTRAGAAKAEGLLHGSNAQNI